MINLHKIFFYILNPFISLRLISGVLRILFGTWWIFTLIVTSYYIAQLTAFMAKVDSSFPVNNLEELVNSSTSKWITISGTALEASIKVIFEGKK